MQTEQIITTVIRQKRGPFVSDIVAANDVRDFIKHVKPGRLCEQERWELKIYFMFNDCTLP